MKTLRGTTIFIKSFKYLLAAIVAAVVFGFLLIYFGAYNVSALKQHTPPVYKILELALLQSAGSRSSGIEPPAFSERDELAGLILYDEHCRQCHGAPGVGAEGFALGMLPAPTPIASIASKREVRELFWMIKNGIKMSGMPSWKYRMSDPQIWQVVAFIERVPELTVRDYQLLQERAIAVLGPGIELQSFDPEPDSETSEYGRVALQQYNCAGCHSIPGVTSAANHVGPPLEGIAARSFVAGVLANTEANLVKWIRFPRQVDPDTTMPNLNVSEEHARWMVDYFQTLAEP